MIQMEDDRRIPAIAEEFDGLQSIHYEDTEAEASYDWDEFSKLDSIVTVSPGVVQITLNREV